MVDGMEKDICKMNLDLWIHQNTLMFSRLQTLWFVQFGFLALASYLSASGQHVSGANVVQSDELQPLSKYVAFLCAITTYGIWIMMRTDRLLRNIHRGKIEDLNLGLFPASFGQKPSPEDKGITLVEPVFYYIVFLVFIFIDLYAARFFGLGAVVIGMITAVMVLVSILLPVLEHRWDSARIATARSS